VYNAQVDFWRLVRVKIEVHVYNAQGTFRWRHPVFMAGIRLGVDLLSEAWLNWCRRRDTAVLSAATVKRQTGVVSCDLGGRILVTRNKAHCGIVWLLFSTSRPWSLWSLLPLHSPVISTAVAVCVCLPSSPGRARCVRVGGGGFELPVRNRDNAKTYCQKGIYVIPSTQAKCERKPNEILTHIHVYNAHPNFRPTL